jgi:hypothetical protein
VEEDLLARRPDEILSAVNAVDSPILELHLGVTPLSVISARGWNL